LIRSPKLLICASLLLFLFLALLVPWKDLYRFFFFAGLVPGVIWAFYRGERPASFREPSVNTLVILVVYLSLSSFLISEASLKASFDRFRWGFEILFLIFGTLFASELWMRRPRFYGTLFLCSVFVSGLVALVPYWLAGRFNTRLEGFGFLGHPIQAASTLLMLWAIGVALMSLAPKIRFFERTLLILSGMVMVSIAIFSQSRGPVIASAITVLSLSVSWFSKNNRPRNLIFWVPLTILGFIGALWVLLPEQYTDWFLKMMTDRGLSYRPEIWASVLKNTGSDWILGAGAATDFVDTAAGAALRSELGQVFLHTHNIFLELWIKGGIVSLVLLLGTIYFILKCLAYSSCSVRSKLVAISILLTFLMVNFTDTARLLSSPAADWVLLWLPLVFLASFSFWLRAGKSVDIDSG
jgi:O-antigen ligase